MNEEKLLVRRFIIGTFVSLYVITSLVSMVHVISFFRLSNPEWLAITLSIAYELGAAASLAAIIALRKMNKSIVWGLFIILTAMQAMGNTYFAYINLQSYQSWAELFNLVDLDVIQQKRILSLVSGAILPIIALGFIKALIDYIRPDENKDNGKETLNVPIENKNLFGTTKTHNTKTNTTPPVVDKPLMVNDDVDVDYIKPDETENETLSIPNDMGSDVLETKDVVIPDVPKDERKRFDDDTQTASFLNQIKFFNSDK